MSLVRRAGFPTLSKNLGDRSIGAKMASTVDTPAHFDPERQLCINYGFYDSGLLRSKQGSSLPCLSFHSGR